jgi:hypothetical protein
MFVCEFDVCHQLTSLYERHGIPYSEGDFLHKSKQQTKSLTLIYKNEWKIMKPITRVEAG